MKNKLLVLVYILNFTVLKSQTLVTIGSGTLSSGASSSSPINIYYRSHHCQILYTATEINNAGFSGPGAISKLGFNVLGTTTEGLPNFCIKLKNSNSNDLNVYEANGFTTVYNSSLYWPNAGNFDLLNFSNSFTWDGLSNLLVDVCFDQVGSYTATGEVYTYTYTNTGSEYEFIRDDNNPQCGVATTNSISLYKPQIQFEITPLTPCVSNPNGGNASSDQSIVCSNNSLNLNLNNGTTASGLVYQWQSSTNGVNYTNFGSSQSIPNYFIPNLSSTTYYRCITTCTNSALSATSTPITVNINPFYNCYCQAPTLNCFNGDIISKVILSNLSDSTMTCTSGSYQDRSIIDTILLVANQTYSLNVTSNYTNEKIGYWIDYDNNGTFDSYEYSLITHSSVSGINTHTLQIPITATGGLTKLRLMLENGPAIPANPCSSSSYYGTTLDYIVDITAAPVCTLTPNAGNAIATATSVCNNVSFTLDLIGNSAASGITYQWQNSLNATTWTNLTTPQNIIPLTISSQSVTNYYRCITTCTASAISATSTPVTVLQSSFLDCYCYPGTVACSSNSANMTNVIIAGISYTPVCDPSNNYFDETNNAALTFSLTANQSYSISVDITSPFTTAYVGGWIDYDQNGIFDDMEYIAVGTSTGGNIVTSFTVPYTAIGGNTHLRLKMESSYSATTLSACTNNSYDGQTIDYLVNITAATPCSGTTNAGLTTSSSPSVCANTNFTLNLTGNSQVSGLNYQWQTSTDNLSWTNLSASQNIVPFIVNNQSVGSYYRCVVTCSASSSSTSTPIYVAQSSFLYCYCIPPPSNCSFGFEISKVMLSTLTNTSSCSPSGYTDYSSSVPTLSLDAGQTYSINIKVGSDYSSYSTAWIDYDQNGLFDPNEFTSIGNTNGAGDSTIYGIITIPSSALLGNTKLRIRNNLGIELNSDEACTTGMPAKGILTSSSNGETEDYMITILPQNCSTINFPTSIAAIGTATICYGKSDTLNLLSNLPLVTGITYQWKTSNGGAYINEGTILSTTSIIVTPTTNSSYYCEIMCNGNVVLNSDTIFVTVKPSTDIFGSVLTNTTPVAGRVVLYQYEPFFTKFDSVAGQNIGSLGDYNFTSFNSGIYIVKAIPVLNNLQVTYGNSAINWKTATQISHGCSINDIHNINVVALSTFTTTGSGSLSGQIYEGQGFGQRLNEGFKPSVPGNPIGGIVVKGGRNPGGQMFVQTTTDPITGTYTLSGLPDNQGGDSYFILVDIPGLDTNHTYHRIITPLNNNYQGLDFVVDSAKINPLPSAVTSVLEHNGLNHEIKVYPNPTNNYLTIQYELQIASEVKIELVDILGKTVKLLLSESKQVSDKYKNTWQLSELKSGLYFLKMSINSNENIIKISVSN